MKNKFTTQKRKQRKRKLLFFLLMLLLGVFISYQKLEKSKIKIKDKDFVDLIVQNTFSQEENNLMDTILDKTLEITNPIKKLSRDYKEHLDQGEEEKSKEKISPTIYLYNTHQTEEYAPSNFAEFSVNPTVMMNNYIMEDIFNKKGYKTFVEEQSIKEILNSHNWKYSNSYQASRILLEERILEYPTLTYFIDIHRDSLEKEKTTVTIDNKDYARILFIVGLENQNYQKNLEFTEKINQKIKERYPTLSKGIYEKGGIGVNGIYNQDFSDKTILVEIGGYENTTNEVLNTALAFSECFMEVIHE